MNSKPLPDAVREDYPDVSSTESPESRVPCPNRALLIILALSQSNSACNALHLSCHSLSLTPKLSTPVFRCFDFSIRPSNSADLSPLLMAAAPIRAVLKLPV
ncbi:MAG: hypothetical protein QNK64_10715 [Saprospiraceae bacterium]